MLRLFVLVFCVATLAPQYAHADKADRHRRAGLKHLKNHRYDKAIKELEKAHELSSEPVLLFDLAEAYNGKGDYAQALTFYRSYRDADPEGAKARNVDSIIDALASLTADSTTPDPEPPPEVTPPPEPESQPPPENLEPVPPKPPAHEGSAGRGKRIAGIVVMVAGVAAAGTGAYFAKVSRDRADEVSDLFASGGTWSDEYTRLYDEGEAAERNAIILGAAGGAAVIGGVVLYLLGAHDARAEHVAVAPVAGGAVVRLAWSR